MYACAKMLTGMSIYKWNVCTIETTLRGRAGCRIKSKNYNGELAGSWNPDAVTGLFKFIKTRNMTDLRCTKINHHFRTKISQWVELFLKTHALFIFI